LETFGQAPSLFIKFHEDVKAPIPAWATRSIPFSLLAPDVVDCIVQWLKKFPNDEISEFMYFVFDTFHKTEADKFSHYKSTGLWTMLQLLTRKFPELIESILPNIKSNYMTLLEEPEDVYVISKKDKVIIFDFLGIVLQVNPKIALNCWFSVFFPTLVYSSPPIKKVEDDIIQFLELTVKNKKNYSSSEVIGDKFSIEDELLILLEYIFMNDDSSRLYNRFIAFLPNLMDCTVFLNPTTPRLYFNNLLSFASKILPKDNDDEDRRLSEVKFILNTLAVSLVRDPDSHDILIDNYISYFSECSSALIHLGSNWEKLTGKINKNPAVLQALTNTYTTLIATNQQILDNKYKHKGKTIGPRAVRLKPDEITQLSVSFKSILKTFDTAKQQQQLQNAQQVKKRGFCSTICIMLFILLLFFITLYLVIYFKLIPQKYSLIITNNFSAFLKQCQQLIKRI